MSAIMKTLCFSFIILSSFATLFSVTDALRFNVGGNGVWDLNPQENYNTWAERNRFQVNDTLFFKYPKGSDSVQQVMKADFDGCNIRNPIKNFDNGESVVTLDRSGPFYFISGNQDHCKKGQKLIVVVLAVRNHPKVPISPAKPPSSAQPPKSHSPVSPISPAKPPSSAQAPNSHSPVSPIAPAKPPSTVAPSHAPSHSPRSSVSPAQPPKSSHSPALSPSHAPSHSPKSPSPVSHSPSHAPSHSPATLPPSPSPVSHSPSHAPSHSPATSPPSPSPDSTPSPVSPASSPSDQTPPLSPSPSQPTPSADNITAPAPSPKRNSASGVAVTSVMTTLLSAAFTFLMFA
ncbi:early nodulin-like protein 2 [Capsella rubella]|nr:early nodulin-like protein 2 [Capsella rubella]